MPDAPSSHFKAPSIPLFAEMIKARGQQVISPCYSHRRLGQPSARCAANCILILVRIPHRRSPTSTCGYWHRRLSTGATSHCSRSDSPIISAAVAKVVYRMLTRRPGRHLWVGGLRCCAITVLSSTDIAPVKDGADNADQSKGDSENDYHHYPLPVSFEPALG